jgi:Mn-dependent DtxR family transcriptional regulator
VPLGLGDAMLDVLTVVREAEYAVGPAEVAQKLGIDSKTAIKYLTRLDDRGDIIKAGRGIYVSKASKVFVGAEDG